MAIPRILIATMALAAPALPAAADGTVSGTVRLGRTAPKPTVVAIHKDSSVCGTEARSEALIVGPGGGLANAVVSVKGLRPPKPPAPLAGVTVDQVRCRYVPHVQAVTVGTGVTLLNSDAVFHNVHGHLAASGVTTTVFNVAMPMKGQKLPAVLKRPGIVQLRCDAGHTWMNAYVHVFDHPHYAVTDGAGAFAIKNVPPGRHMIEVWHEPVAEKGAALTRTVEVDVIDGSAAAVEVTLAP